VEAQRISSLSFFCALSRIRRPHPLRNLRTLLSFYPGGSTVDSFSTSVGFSSADNFYGFSGISFNSIKLTS
jgi:hypothetical protein